ncbi:MAG TPA: response regulator transcription factor [Clostridia bacterium]|nr:response regulator transcription factor [Clostridia bacterium]
MRILVAEDERDIRELIEIHLIKDGYQVLTAKDGIEALDVFKSEALDLAVLDVNMPKLNGFKVLNKIRKESKIPVILLTARGSDEDKILGLGLGADDYLTKPISMVELVARIKAHFRRNYEYIEPKNEEKKILESGDLLIDLEQFSAFKKGELLDLNAKEFKLLIYFMKNEGKVFTKKQIYEEVWDDYYYGDNNTIMVYISRLRSKIEDEKDQVRYIKTIRGIGYRFEGKE